MGCVVVARGLKHCGARALLPCSMWDLSSLTRDWTPVTCIGRKVLNHWITRKVSLYLDFWLGILDDQRKLRTPFSCRYFQFLSQCLAHCCCCLVTKSCLTHGLQHARLPRPSLFPRAYSNTYPLSQWCHPTIWSSVTPFSSCLQSFPASEAFPMSWLYAGGQSIGVSASASVLPVNTQDWFPSGWTGWISLQSKGLSRVFSTTMIWKHPFFGAQHSLCSNSHICTNCWKNHSFGYMDLCLQSGISAF